jgi:hypothetical protein
MAIFTCSIGDYAVVRYCVARNQTSEKDLHRTEVQFEVEINSENTTVIKYDVVDVATLEAVGTLPVHKRPPYIVPNFKEMADIDISKCTEANLMRFRMRDAMFF